MYDALVVIITLFCIAIVMIGVALIIALWLDQPIGKRSKWWKKHIVGDAPEDYDG